MKINIIFGLGVLKVFAWGAPGKFSQARRPLGGGSGQPREALGSCVVLGKNQIKSRNCPQQVFFSKPAAAQCPNCFLGDHQPPSKRIFPPWIREGNQRATSCLQLMSNTHIRAIIASAHHESACESCTHLSSLKQELAKSMSSAL